MKNFQNFPRYTDYDPKVPVWCLTPNVGRCIHRFFDTIPLSPSGRYLAVFRLPFEDRLNVAGEAGEIVVVDLESGEEKVVAQTYGWEAQMGANLNWGHDDRTLVFNDVDVQTWEPQLVKLDWPTGKSERIPGGVYHVSPDGRYAAAASMDKMCRTQEGYGVLLPRERAGRNIGAPEDDGLFITDLETGERRLVFSLARAAESIPDLQGVDLEDWELYGFHSKWSHQGDRLIFTVRRFLKDGPKRFGLMSGGQNVGQPLQFDVFTVKADGSEIYNAVPAEYWQHGGNHINWYPDGSALSMNLSGFGEGGHRFVRVGIDGSDLRPLLKDTLGSGHPILHPESNHIMADTYAGESMAFGDGTVPIRWVNLETAEETCLVRVGARVEPEPTGILRVDPHIVWDRDWRYVVFNGVAQNDNTRRVYIADMEAIL